MKPQPLIDSATDQLRKLLSANWSELLKLQEGSKKLKFNIAGTVTLGPTARMEMKLGFGVREKFSSSEEIDNDQLALELDGANAKPKRQRKPTQIE